MGSEQLVDVKALLKIDAVSWLIWIRLYLQVKAQNLIVGKTKVADVIEGVSFIYFLKAQFLLL